MLTWEWITITNITSIYLLGLKNMMSFQVKADLLSYYFGPVFNFKTNILALFITNIFYLLVLIPTLLDLWILFYKLYSLFTFFYLALIFIFLQFTCILSFQYFLYLPPIITLVIFLAINCLTGLKQVSFWPEKLDGKKFVYETRFTNIVGTRASV